jgi:DNA-binding HxlR family transcriptional regulator
MRRRSAGGQCDFCTCIATAGGHTRPVRYEQVCPVSLASEVIAERWTPLILREIVLFDRHRFNEIQRGVGRISQSILTARLRSLERAGVVRRQRMTGGKGWEYHPTQAGRELEPVLDALAMWAQHWLELRREDCEPGYLMQTVHGLLIGDRLPNRPVTVRFEFRAAPKLYWLVIDGPHPELCYNDPGRDIDLVVRLEERAFGGVILGRLGFDDAVRSGAIELDGPPDLVRAFPTWLGMTRYARYARPSRDGGAVVSWPAAMPSGSP